jgi:hypothetical protein
MTRKLRPVSVDRFPPIDVAALNLVTSLSAHNLAEGTSPTVNVERELVYMLRAALEDSYPGVVNRTYLRKRRAAEQARKAS